MFILKFNQRLCDRRWSNCIKGLIRSIFAKPLMQLLQLRRAHGPQLEKYIYNSTPLKD